MMPNPNRLPSPALVACVIALVAIAGCNPFRRGERVAACNKPQLYAAAEAVPPLQIPVGLDAPNTRAAMRIPDLNEPEAPRRPGDPCLDAPPKFSNTARLEPLPKGKDAPKPRPAAAPAGGAAPVAPAPAPGGAPPPPPPAR
jgi:hypothetical protein